MQIGFILKQSIPYLKHLSKIVSIGRIKWIEGSSGVGKIIVAGIYLKIIVKKLNFW